MKFTPAALWLGSRAARHRDFKIIPFHRVFESLQSLTLRDLTVVGRRAQSDFQENGNLRKNPMDETAAAWREELCLKRVQ